MKLLPTMGSAYSGSLRGITASHNKGGAYFRGRTIPTNPGTSYQTTVRNSVAMLMQTWSNMLTQSQRDAWNLYAANVSWVDKLGQTIQLSGINHYLRSNVPRVQESVQIGALSVINDAPTTYSLGLSPQVASAAISHNTGPPETVLLELTIDNAGDFSAGDIGLVYLSAGLNPGIGFYKGPYILAGEMDLTSSGLFLALYDDTPTAALWNTRFGVPPVGNRIFGYIRSAMDDGRLSGKITFDAGLIPVAS